LPDDGHFSVRCSDFVNNHGHDCKMGVGCSGRFVVVENNKSGKMNRHCKSLYGDFDGPPEHLLALELLMKMNADDFVLMQ
jgi:hypothetical protein